MKVVVIVLALVSALACAAPRNTSMPDYPATRRNDFTYEIHGTTLVDPYHWLEDGHSDEVKTWARAQDAVTRDYLAKLPERDAIAARLRELFYVDDAAVPVKRGGRYFIARRKAHDEKWVVWVRDGKDGAERTLLDPNAWSSDGSVSLGRWVPSWDGTKVAYQTKANNSDEATLHVIDVATGAKSDAITGAKYASPSWTPGGDGFYYTWLPTDPAIPAPELPGHAELRFHRLGSDPASDAVIHPATHDPGRFVSGGVSRDGRFLIVSIYHGWNSTDVFFKDLASTAPELVPLVVGRDAQFGVEAWKDRLYVTTNDGAPRWRMFAVDPARPARDQWTEVVPERPDAILAESSIVGGRLALSYMKDVATRLEVRELDGRLVREIPLPGIGTASVPAGEPDDDEAYFAYTSHVHPREIREISVSTGEQRVVNRVSVPIDASKFESEQVFCTSKDGTRVPVFVIRAKDLKRDGTAPCILYGYGGFLDSQTPHFMSSVFPWLERGGIFAIACLRGGNEYGEEWHRAGMLLNKQNVFDDFAAAAEHLAREKYTSSRHLVIQGESNGGLLVGAAITQRPELYRAALCGVPLLDMVRYHRSGSGSTWVSEYGSSDDPAQFKALLAYSPYHHVTPGTRYPAVLLSSADSDDRVDPMHARKFAALLQASSTGGPVLLRVEKNAGHGGADMVRAWVEVTADQLAFALAQAGGGADGSAMP